MAIHGENITFDADNELERLTNFSRKVTTRVAKIALSSGMRELAKREKLNAPVCTGKLKKSIGYTYPKDNRGTISSSVYFKRDKNFVSKNGKREVPHGYYVSNGTKFVKPNKFLKNTFFDNKSKVISVITQNFEHGVKLADAEVTKTRGES
jgi:HK97 gp10 family phage protein